MFYYSGELILIVPFDIRVKFKHSMAVAESLSSLLEIFHVFFRTSLPKSEAFSEPSQASKMELRSISFSRKKIYLG